jgi:hypothetical protein
MLFSVPILLHHLVPKGTTTSRGISLDISEAGLGALVQQALQVGQIVGIDLLLEKGDLTTAAIVRYSSRVRSGFEFIGLTPEERDQIRSAAGAN